MTEIIKAAGVSAAGAVREDQLEKINRISKTRLGKEDVYVFAVRLCDDQPDRDYERFSPEAIRTLKELFIGKTGIMDHEWSAGQQVARIFDTEIEYEAGAMYLKAWVYMLRLPENEGLIRSIEGGIKKEVSIGCAVKQSLCSICGEPYGSCSHRKGEVYSGQTCVAILTEPTDAYEFSFVAVPAQKEAGVLRKGLSRETPAEREVLEWDAALGRVYRRELENRLVRMALTLEVGPEEELLRRMAAMLPQKDLADWNRALEEKFAELFCGGPQLTRKEETASENNGAFLI